MNAESAPADIAPLYAALARAALMKGNPEAALRHAWEAIEHDADETALSLIRELEGAYSKDAKFFRILVNGSIVRDHYEDDEPRGFWRKFDVVADDEEEAMRFISRIELAQMRGSLRADEVEIVESAPDQPKGVYWCSVHAFYRDADE